MTNLETKKKGRKPLNPNENFNWAEEVVKWRKECRADAGDFVVPSHCWQQWMWFNFKATIQMYALILMGNRERFWHIKMELTEAMV